VPLCGAPSRDTGLPVSMGSYARSLAQKQARCQAGPKGLEQTISIESERSCSDRRGGRAGAEDQVGG
jgi:hypothetical protein